MNESSTAMYFFVLKPAAVRSLGACVCDSAPLKPLWERELKTRKPWSTSRCCMSEASAGNPGICS